MSDLARNSGSKRGVSWILTLRLVLALFCLGGVLLLDDWPVRPAEPRFFAGLLFLFAIVLDLAFFLMRHRVRLRLFLFAQLGVDYFLVTGILYLTGGADSVFLFLYFLIILGAAMVLSRRTSLVLASLATVGTAAVTILYSLHTNDGFPDPFHLQDGVLIKFSLGRTTLLLVSQGIAFHAVALLSGILAERLRRLTLLYGLLLDNMPEGLLAVDAQERIAFLNSEARTLLGIPPGTAVDGKPVRQVLQRGEAAAVADVLLSREAANWEVSLPGDGESRSVNIRVSAVRDRKGRMRGAVGVLTDLTLRKRLETAERTAEHLEGLREVAAGIAHEIRNPLASIRGCVQELVRDTMGEEEEKELAGIIYRESDRLDGILQEFLRFTGMRDPVRRPLDLAGLLDEVVVLLEARDDVKPDSILREYEGPSHLTGDRGQLQQVFLNLGINALEASPPGSPICFRIRSTRMTRVGSRRLGSQMGQQVMESKALEVSVHDRGAGIDPENRSKIFTPFFTTKATGTGLGLAVVNRIVRGHGGDVEVESVPGEGCTFRVRLPVEKEIRVEEG